MLMSSEVFLLPKAHELMDNDDVEYPNSTEMLEEAGASLPDVPQPPPPLVPGELEVEYYEVASLFLFSILLALRLA